MRRLYRLRLVCVGVYVRACVWRAMRAAGSGRARALSSTGGPPRACTRRVDAGQADRPRVCGTMPRRSRAARCRYGRGVRGGTRTAGRTRPIFGAIAVRCLRCGFARPAPMDAMPRVGRVECMRHRAGCATRDDVRVRTHSRTHSLTHTLRGRADPSPPSSVGRRGRACAPWPGPSRGRRRASRSSCRSPRSAATARGASRSPRTKASRAMSSRAPNTIAWPAWARPRRVGRKSTAAAALRMGAAASALALTPARRQSAAPTWRATTRARPIPNAICTRA